MKFKSDIDIDFADRDDILKLIEHTSARQDREDGVRKHNSGVYVTEIPYDPINDCASIDYESAEERGYVKIDFLNVNVYKLIRDNDHYTEMLNQEPNWSLLKNKDFVEKVIHIGNHHKLIKDLEVNSIPRMAMFLALIRPGKRHLLGKDWATIAEDIWTVPDDGSYYFKKAHAVSYAVLVALHMNLLDESLRTQGQ
jgi:hypothetical protein